MSKLNFRPLVLRSNSLTLPSPAFAGEGTEGMPIQSCSVFLAALAVIVRGLAPAFTGDDSGELALAAVTLNVTHPPGYPLFCLAGRLAQLLPLGCPAFRVNLLTALSGAASVTLVHSITRTFLARLGRRSVAVPLLAAFLALSLPPLFHQSTQAEKYAPYAVLALLAVRTFLEGDRQPYMVVFSFALALAHHPMALFLFPLLWPARRLARDLPSLALAVSLVLLPLSVKVLYPAMRASPAALSAEPTLFPWGEPAQARNLANYLAVRQYGGRFTRSPVSFVARLAPQVAQYPLRMTFVVTAAALIGAALAAPIAPGLVFPLLAVIPLHWLLAGSMSLDLHLTPQFHLVPQLMLVVFAAAAAALLPCLVGPALLGLLLAAGIMAGSRALPLDAKDRDFSAWDYNRSLLALSPPHAALLAGMDNDLFPLRYLSLLEGERPDVVVLNSPFFSTTSSLSGAMRGAPPDLVLPPGPDLGPYEAFRQLLRLPSSRCIALSGFNEPLFPGTLEFLGPLAFPVSRPCAFGGGTDRQLGVWRRLPLRGFFSPATALPRQRAILNVYEVALSVATQRFLAGGKPAAAAQVSAFKSLLFPRAPSTWLEKGNLALARGDAAAARASFMVALDLAPDLVDSYASALFLAEVSGDSAGLLALLEKARASLPEMSKESAGKAEIALKKGKLAEGAATFRAALAALALAQGDAESRLGEIHLRRSVALYSLAARLNPVSPAARKTE